MYGNIHIYLDCMQGGAGVVVGARKRDGLCKHTSAATDGLVVTRNRM